MQTVINKESFEIVGRYKTFTEAAKAIRVTRGGIYEGRIMNGLCAVKKYYIIDTAYPAARAYIKTLKMQRMLENPDICFKIAVYVEEAWSRFEKDNV